MQLLIKALEERFPDSSVCQVILTSYTGQAPVEVESNSEMDASLAETVRTAKEITLADLEARSL